MNKEKLENAKNLFFIALGVDIAVTALVVISGFWGVGVLKDIEAGRITADQSTISALEFWGSFAKFQLLTILGVGLGLVKWLNTCYGYAEETIGASGFKNQGWTIGGWIIPIINIFKPYQVINEIYKSGNPTYAIPDGWKKESGSGLLLTWWIFWVVTRFIEVTVGKEIFNNALRDDMNFQQIVNAFEFRAWFCMVFLVVSGLWFVVANELTRRLLERQIAGGSLLSHGRSEAVTNQTHETPRSPKQAVTRPSNECVVIRQSAAHSVGTSAVKKSPPAMHENNITSTPAMNTESATEEDHWATAMAEVESAQRRPGVWAKAFAECEGDETKSKVAYLKARVQQLIDAEKMSQAQLARQETERHRLEAVEAELAEQLRRRNAGLADPELVTAVWNGNLSTARRLLDGGVKPFGSDENGTSILDLAKKRGDQQMVALLKDHAMGTAEHKKTDPEITEQLVADAIAKFQSGKPPTVDEVIFLTEAAINNPSIAKISDHLHNNTLLHWCARLNLDRSATVLIQLNADAGAFNNSGQQAHQLSKGTALATILTAAANGA